MILLIRKSILSLVLTFIFFYKTPPLFAQGESKLNINIVVDTKSAEQTLQLLENKPINTTELAELRGNRIASSTTRLIANQRESALILKNYLDSLKYHEKIKNDIYNLEVAAHNVKLINELLAEMKKRNFSRKIAATVEQIFPQDAEINLIIPLYVVVLGHENVDAYVRRIIWHGDIPEFVGENEGELTIVINLAQSIRTGLNLEERFISLLCITAHEVFHAAFSAYKEKSKSWKKYYTNYNRPVDQLLDLTMNEGIAYYLTLDQRGRGYLPRDWNERIQEAFKNFNESVDELLSDDLKTDRLYELLRSANLSGYWNSYGSITGMFIAREIDLVLGRAVLMKAIATNTNFFFEKYFDLLAKNSNLPQLNSKLSLEIGRK